MRNSRAGIFPFTVRPLRSAAQVMIAVYILISGTVENAVAQTRLILDGAIITLNDAYLVINNPASNAITRNSGHIISEAETSVIKWNIGTTTGTYTIPWGYGVSDYIPLTFTKTAGTGSGHFVFSTYHTGWQNSTQLPSIVSNMNGATGTDNSAFVSDRFWQIAAIGYTAGFKPTLSNVVLTYLDAENSAVGNTITESGLIAKRYNNNLSSWTDNILASTVNTTDNTVTITSVSDADLFKWWVLGSTGANRYWVAPSNSSSNLAANWSATAGGAGNAGVPTPIDAVIFDGTSDANCALNADLTAANLLVNAGYTGTITQGASAITLSSAATFSGGTFSGGTAGINVAGPFTLSGTSFTSTSGTLDLQSDFNFTSGSFAHNNGTVRFSGTATQNVTGAASANFNNIAVTNTTATPGVSIESNQNIVGVLTLSSNAIFDADGSNSAAVFKLISTGDNPTADAGIATLPSGAQVTGSVTVQRYTTKEGPNGGRIYRYLSSPVQNAPVSDLQNEIPITGTFTGASTCAGCTQSMFSYNEAVITDSNNSGVADVNDGYIDFPDASNAETLIPGKGYAMFVPGSVLSSTAWDVRGTVNAGNVTPVSLPVTFTSSGTIENDGWNLVGNPFPSTIDWNAGSGWTKTNLDAAIYMRDNGGETAIIATWNGVTSVNGGSRYIATGQAFWVKASGSGAPVLQANENTKTAGTQTTFFRERRPDNLLRITMVKGSTRDESVIHFRKDATANFDPQADALKLYNSTFNLSSVLPDGRKVAINSVPAMNCKTEIKLAVEYAAAGAYRLNFSEHESFAGSMVITLNDNFTGSSFNILSGNGYDFSVTADPASRGSERFKITFDRPPLDSSFQMSAAGICEGSAAMIHISNTQKNVTYVATADRSALSPPVTGTGGTITLSVPGDKLTAGVNNIAVSSAWDGCSSQHEKSIALNVRKTFEIASVEGAKSCREGSMTLKATGAPEDGHYNWYESVSSAAPLAEQHASSFTTPLLQESTTYYTAIVSSSGCESVRHPVLAEVVQFEDARILLSESGDSLRSNYAHGNQWYFNHTTLPGATAQSIKPNATGTYRVDVTVNGCVTSSEHEFAITGIEDPAGKFMTVSPNPIIRELKVDVPDSFGTIEAVRVINSFGQVVGLIELHSLNSKRSGHFDMANYPAGLYVLQTVGTHDVMEVKIIKQ
jgi:hypothetical protein